jgi:hypothetical protein
VYNRAINKREARSKRETVKTMKNMRCIKCEQIEERNGYVICREEDRQYNDFTGEYSGRVHVYYTVNTEDMMLESLKTLREARKYADEN